MSQRSWSRECWVRIGDHGGWRSPHGNDVFMSHSLPVTCAGLHSCKRCLRTKSFPRNVYSLRKNMSSLLISKLASKIGLLIWRQLWRERRDRKRSSMHWFTSQITAMPGLLQGEARSLRPRLSLQGPNSLDGLLLLSQRWQQEAGLEAESPRLKLNGMTTPQAGSYPTMLSSPSKLPKNMIPKLKKK